MALSAGFRIPVSLLILLPKPRGCDSCPGGTDSHRTRQPSLDAPRQPCGKLLCAAPTAAARLARVGARAPTSDGRHYPLQPLSNFGRNRGDVGTLDHAEYGDRVHELHMHCTALVLTHDDVARE